MNRKINKCLHLLLIIMLMITPLRSVLAMPLTPCDMAQAGMEHGADHSTADQDADRAMIELHRSMGHDMSHMLDTASDQHNDVKQQASTDCCCCENSNCASLCDTGITVSLSMQVSPAQPTYMGVSLFNSDPADIIIRQQAPPPRPPRAFS